METNERNTDAADPGRKKIALRPPRGQGLAAFGFLLPNLIGFVAFTLFPVLFSLWLSFTNWSMKPAVHPEFVGLRNFADILTHDNYFWQYFYNTAYLMLGIPVSIAGSLLLALMLNEELPFGEARIRWIAAGICVVFGSLSGLLLTRWMNADYGLLCSVVWWIAALGIAFNVVAFRTLFYLPSFTAGVALMVLWKAMYNPETGPINAILEAGFRLFGMNVKGPEWLGDVKWAKPAMIVMGIWMSVGGTNMLLYLAALANLPQELLDAAEVDGAGSWARFKGVVWPHLMPTTFFISIMSIIGGFQGGFEQARVLTNGGPAGATTTLSYYIYTKAFRDLDLGYASAISWILFAIVFLATVLNVKISKGLETDG